MNHKAQGSISVIALLLDPFIVTVSWRAFSQNRVLYADAEIVHVRSGSGSNWHGDSWEGGGHSGSSCFSAFINSEYQIFHQYSRISFHC